MIGENDGALGDVSSSSISFRVRSAGGDEGVDDTLCVSEKLSSTTGILKLGLALKNQSSSDNPVIPAIERYWMTSCKSRM